ncbi:hypothetical protein NIES2101_00285 [Calothrix sp. HK-06]|nr:hypothetical protein NIES2101_00285 [Calothrix sp. HK-06]
MILPEDSAMSGRVVSFRIDDEVFAELEQRMLPDESPGQAANRILKSALGFDDATEIGDVQKIIAVELAPILDRLNFLELKVEEIKSTKERSTSANKKPATKLKPKSPNKNEVRSIGYLKSHNVIDKKIKPTEDDIGTFYDGNDGSKWEYLGYQKGAASGLPQKQFQRVN